MIIIREYILGHCYKMSKCSTRLSFIMWTWIVSLNVILFTISRYYSHCFFRKRGGGFLS